MEIKKKKKGGMSWKFYLGMRVGLWSLQNNKPEDTGFPESHPSELWDVTGMTISQKTNVSVSEQKEESDNSNKGRTECLDVSEHKYILGQQLNNHGPCWI